MNVYSDRQYEIHRLKNTPEFKMVVEVYKEGKLIAALFTKERDAIVP